MTRCGKVLIAACIGLLPLTGFAQVMLGSTGGDGGSAGLPGAIVSIDPTDASAIVLGTPFGGVGLAGIEQAPDGTVYAVTGVDQDGIAHLLEVDPATGGLITDLGQLPDSSGNGCAINDLAYHPQTGVLYGLAANNGSGDRCSVGGSPGGYLLTIDTAAVEYTVIGREPSLDNNSGGIAFDAAGTLYFTPGWNDVGTLHTLDLTDGSFTSTVALSEDLGFHGLEINPVSGTMYASLPMTSSCCSPANFNIYTIDPVSGTVTLLGSPGEYSVHDMVFLSDVVVVPQSRATFEVSKDFTDDNPNGVEVTISCNTGLPLEQSKVITEGAGVEFVVVDFDDGEMDCEITEESLAGYDAVYFDGTTNSSTSCEFLDVGFESEFSCSITNTPGPVEVEIIKDWVFEGSSDPQGIDQRYELTLWCDAEIVDGEQVGDAQETPSGFPGPFCGLIVLEGVQGSFFADWCKVFEGEGPDSFTAEVIPEFPESHCFVIERLFDDAVEVDNGCQNITVSAGVGASCTITNTVFFEGIPTLNQYGLALLALLMLGVGFVGFRRFA
jgi:hypothetical protein